MQGEVLEELQHNYPLELLMALSNAAISAMKVLISPYIAESSLIGRLGKGMGQHGIYVSRLPSEELQDASTCDAEHRALIACVFVCIAHMIL